MSSISIPIITFMNVEHIYLRPEVNSNRFEISNRIEESFCLHGDFTVATFLTIIRFYSTCANITFKLTQT